MTFTPQPPHELRPGLWQWTVRHPEWDDDAADEGWGPDVTCYAIEHGDRIVLVDPAQPADGLASLTGGREATVLLTCPWHERDAVALGLPIFGDTLIDRGAGLELPDDWGPPQLDHGPVLDALRELLALPIELALPTHGAPADRAAFERALS